MSKRDNPNRQLDNKMKSKGLQKLRWYCQVCEKQCRDENGFKCHTMTEGHLRQMLVVGESAGKHISDYSSRFQAEFVGLLSRRWGTKRVRINQVYQEYISDKDHLHMNSTRWLSLTEFCKHLGRSGIAHVDETEKGWFVSWIDNSPKALAKAEANQKKVRGDMDDESRQRKLIQEQIERAREEGERRRREREAVGVANEEESANAEEVTQELKRDEGEKVQLSLSFKMKPTTSEVPSSTTTSSTSGFIAPITKPIAPPAFTIKPNPFKANPLKKPNPLKAPSVSSSSAGTKRPATVSAVEAIFQEEMARKNGGAVKKARY